MTRKEIIENGWVEKYVLGLTTEEESSEVERLANLYPEIQENINTARNKICGKFNRSLTQPALRTTFLNKRRMLFFVIAGVAVFSLGFCFLAREHFSLKEEYNEQSKKLAIDEAKLDQLDSYLQATNEQSEFMHAATTKKIKLKGTEAFPEAEAMVFKCNDSGRMLLRVVDLPELEEGQTYEVWAVQASKPDRLVGLLKSPLRYDSLYTLDSVRYASALQIRNVDLMEQSSVPVCVASATN